VGGGSNNRHNSRKQKKQQHQMMVMVQQDTEMPSSVNLTQMSGASTLFNYAGQNSHDQL